jgi:hypothetical protein
MKNTEHYLVTSQELSTFDIFSFDGMYYQIIGHASDGYLVENIDYDETAETVDLDINLVKEFDLGDY